MTPSEAPSRLSIWDAFAVIVPLVLAVARLRSSLPLLRIAGLPVLIDGVYQAHRIRKRLKTGDNTSESTP